MNSRDFKGALNLAYQIKDLGSHYAVSYIASGILIDVGNAVGDEKIIREGVELLKRDFEAIIRHKRYAPTAYYNLANGYYALFRFKIMKDPYVVCFRETELNRAISYYRRALNYKLKDAMLADQYRLPRCLGLFLLTLMFLTPVIEIVVANSVNDPLAPDQWGWYRIKADKAYETGYHGSGIIVAVLDTGIDTDHPDLAANIVDGWNFVDNNDNVTDLDGHGTMVSGIIAAVANNSIGIVGVSPNVSIMPLKVLSTSGGSWIDLDRAILRAANNGAKVIVMSLGGKYSLLSPATEAAINYAYRKGCILIASAGNDNSNEPFYPAAYEKVIAVSAIDQNDTKALFSNFGSYIDFCVPGVSILSTCKDGSYAYGSGTSFAAPFVAGVVALMLSKYPQLSVEEVIETLRVQAEDLGEEGWDHYYGWGLVNAYSAVSQTPIPEFPTSISLILVSSTTTTAFLLLKKVRSACKRSCNFRAFN